MAYNPVTDFLGLTRLVGTAATPARAPGLDIILSALARAGLYTLSTGQTAPTVNQSTTVWLKPAEPSWTAEGVIYIWDATVEQYALATPELWGALFVQIATASFQSVVNSTGTVAKNTTLLAVQRVAPVATQLLLSSVQVRKGLALQVVDWSQGVNNHSIILTPAADETIMRLPNLELVSTAVQLSGVTLYPSTDLNGWVIAP